MAKTPYARTATSESRESKMRAAVPKILAEAGYREIQSRVAKGMQLVDAVSREGERITAWVKCAWAPKSHGNCAVQIDFPAPGRRPKDYPGVVEVVQEKAERAKALGATHLLLYAANDDVSRPLAAYLMIITQVGPVTREAIQISPNHVKNGHSPSLYIVARTSPRTELVKVVQAHSIDLLARSSETQASRSDAVNDLDQVPAGSIAPGKTALAGFTYERDSDVRAFVLKRAKGRCEYCGQLGFLMEGGERFLEAHHIVSLAKQGPDTVENVIALCANDHREAHYGANKLEIERKMIHVLSAVSGVRQSGHQRDAR